MANLSDILTNYQSVDTLDSVTDRGATTTNAITIGNLTSTGIDDNATSTALTVTDSGIAATLTTAAQPNITSVGTLSSLSVTGDLTVDTSTLYVDSTNNRVGIGTTSPSNPLNVIATNTNVLIEGSGVSSTGIAFETNNTTRASIGVANASTALSFFSDAGSTETMRIDSSGNVGIGTNSPSYLLDVNGTYRHGDERTIYQAGGGATNYWFKIYEKHYRTPNAFDWDIAEVDYYGGGQTGGNQYACRLLINVKQQQASDLFQVTMYENINMTNNVAYRFDSGGGNASNGLLEVWIRQPTNYVQSAIFVRRLAGGGENSGGVYSMTSTGSTTQPAGSTLVTGSSY